MTITISLPPEVEEALKSVGKKSRRDEMFIDKSQPSRTVAHLWATEQPFRSYRRLECDIDPSHYYKHFAVTRLFPTYSTLLTRR